MAVDYTLRDKHKDTKHSVANCLLRSPQYVHKLHNFQNSILFIISKRTNKGQ